MRILMLVLAAMGAFVFYLCIRLIALWLMQLGAGVRIAGYVAMGLGLVAVVVGIGSYADRCVVLGFLCGGALAPVVVNVMSRNSMRKGRVAS